jgi:hypothetical protein
MGRMVKFRDLFRWFIAAWMKGIVWCSPMLDEEGGALEQQYDGAG